MYLVTLRIDSLRDLAEIPEQFEMLECKPDTGGIMNAPTERWNGNTLVVINNPDLPYTGNYQDTVDALLEQHAGTQMSYSHLKELIEAFPWAGNSASQVRSVMKNHGLITKV